MTILTYKNQKDHYKKAFGRKEIKKPDINKATKNLKESELEKQIKGAYEGWYYFLSGVKHDPTYDIEDESDWRTYLLRANKAMHEKNKKEFTKNLKIAAKKFTGTIRNEKLKLLAEYPGRAYELARKDKDKDFLNEALDEFNKRTDAFFDPEDSGDGFL